MTDRELLEMAAKAAGLTTAHKWNSERLEMTPPVDALVVHCDGKLVTTGWDPLTDDGHALRLAVKLSFCVTQWFSHNQPETMVGYTTPDKKGHNWIEDHNGDPYAATRRAIVCAAAEIGKDMTQGDKHACKMD